MIRTGPRASARLTSFITIKRTKNKKGVMK